MPDIRLIEPAEFERVRQAVPSREDALPLLAAMSRFNTMSAIKRAGSGHPGTSLSAMDVVVYLYECRLNTLAKGIDHPDRDIYFSSKGHDAPGLYAVLHSHGIIPTPDLLALRRLKGLHGHPDVGTPGIEANTGSLGMGIAKGRGMLAAKYRLVREGTVTVMLGDGELQEGQIWESLQTTAHQAGLRHELSRLTLVIDRNSVQSDLPTEKVVAVEPLGKKLAAFGWHVQRIDGHDYTQIARAFSEADAASEPCVIIADTIKGKGITFMEHPRALAENEGTYRWHSGAPDDANFELAAGELSWVILKEAEKLGLDPIQTIDANAGADDTNRLAFQNAMGEPVSISKHQALVRDPSEQYVAEAYGQTLLDLADEVPEMVVLDADLSADCRVRGFEKTHPNRFYESGIAEQDMVSMAGGFSAQGMLPVVNSFACFLCSRAQEQIYNNDGEKRRIIYALHYAGLIPAGPGKSHQSLRDIALMGPLPGVTIVQPSSAAESAALTKWSLTQAEGSVAIRLIIGPSPSIIDPPAHHTLAPGVGWEVAPGSDATMVAYGPVMLTEAVKARDLLAKRSVSLRVLAMPWLNRFDPAFLADMLGGEGPCVIVEDHSPVGGLGDRVLAEGMKAGLLGDKQVVVCGVEGQPACGTPTEALAFHALDGLSLADRVARVLQDGAVTAS